MRGEASARNEKMTIVLWLMAYPMITGLGFALNPLLKERSPLVRNLVTTAIFVPFMVYGGVPSARQLINKLEKNRKQEKYNDSIS